MKSLVVRTPPGSKLLLALKLGWKVRIASSPRFVAVTTFSALVVEVCCILFINSYLALFIARMSLRRRIRPQDARPTPVARVGGGRNYGFGISPNTMRPAVMLLAKAVFIPLASAAPLHPIWPGHGLLRTLEDDAPPDAADPNLWLYLAVALTLVLLGGVFAGLTIALMGQDETYLQVIATSGEGSERRHAEKVLALLNKGKHWVLVTLLLSNVITNETLPIVLDRSLGGGWPAVLGSTVLIGMCIRYMLGWRLGY